MMASMRNGQGDDFFILFNNSGAIIKGFDHESPMSPYAHKPKRVWPGVLDDVPDVFRSFLDEPAFTIEDTTFCKRKIIKTRKCEFAPFTEPTLKNRHYTVRTVTYL